MTPGEKGECGGGCIARGGQGGVGVRWQRLNWEKQGAGIVLSSPL